MKIYLQDDELLLCSAHYNENERALEIKAPNNAWTNVFSVKKHEDDKESGVVKAGK